MRKMRALIKAMANKDGSLRMPAPKRARLEEPVEVKIAYERPAGRVRVVRVRAWGEVRRQVPKVDQRGVSLQVTISAARALGLPGLYGERGTRLGSWLEDYFGEGFATRIELVAS